MIVRRLAASYLYTLTSAEPILNGFVDGNINSYANYFVGSSYVPEPSTWALLVFGAGLGFWMRKKRV